MFCISDKVVFFWRPYYIICTLFFIRLFCSLQVASSYITKHKPGTATKVLEKLLAYLNDYIHIEDVFIAKTVRELVWGYQDTLLEFLHELGLTTMNPIVG